jgi:hypothetical protein
MAYYAHLDDNDIVLNIIVSDKEHIESGEFGDPKYLIETDINTHGNVHYGDDNQPDGGTPLRGNYASIGGKYDRNNDVFYTLQPYASWIIDPTTWQWTAPVPKPPRSETTVNVWNETTHKWDQVPR